MLGSWVKASLQNSWFIVLLLDVSPLQAFILIPLYLHLQQLLAVISKDRITKQSWVSPQPVNLSQVWARFKARVWVYLSRQGGKSLKPVLGLSAAAKRWRQWEGISGKQTVGKALCTRNRGTRDKSSRLVRTHLLQAQGRREWSLVQTSGFGEIFPW